MDEKLIATLAQGGSFAVLVGLTCWLMYMVPKWLEASTAVRESEVAGKVALVREFASTVQHLATQHSEALARVADQARVLVQSAEQAAAARHVETVHSIAEVEKGLSSLLVELTHQLDQLRAAADFERRAADALAELGRAAGSNQSNAAASPAAGQAGTHTGPSR